MDEESSCNIAKARGGATRTGSAAGELSRQAGMLKAEVEQFLSGIHTA